MTFRHPSLFPHIDGVPNLTAYGDYALCYKHPGPAPDTDF